MERQDSSRRPSGTSHGPIVSLHGERGSRAHERYSRGNDHRNWTELVQELRSTQTGVQVLTAFLLTVPFTDKFDSLDQVQRTAYLMVLAGAVAATAAILSPIAYHRILFRRGPR